MTNTENTPRRVLVTGASGQQGGSVIRALIDRGYHVRALTRNDDTDWARSMAERGVEIAVGNLTDVASLKSSLTGVDTVFLVTTPFEEGVDVETEQGIRMIEAAAEANVGHLVFSSVASADQKTGIPHFESKYRVEEAIVASGVPNTIVAPVFFMDNFTSEWMLSGILSGTLSAALPGPVALQQIAVDDIGKFVASIIERRESVFGQRFDIAGDELTGDAVAEALSAAMGRNINYTSFPPDVLRESNEDFAIMYEWFDRVGYSVDIPGLRSAFPEVGWLDFAAWSSAQNWE